MALERIVSGGQTGVDRGALDAALARGFPCGGWCPEGRLVEDGAIPERYPVTELSGAGYPERTLRNVLDSDATAILAFGTLEGGSALTRELCVEHGKPHLVIDAESTSPKRAAALLRRFLDEHAIRVLNVAGPR
ncbi:MAG TPA: putative molybdenum carrier protein, partial [Thermoanaerobaculia bacterium]|nr:putative molybdenum carrier protein [Thermoanaerobaculia bacterium]